MLTLPTLSGAVLTVDKTAPNNKVYTHLKAAIAAAQAGDTLLVKQGVYEEGNIRIEKPLCLIGENFPILEGSKKYEILSIYSDSVWIEGFKVQHSGFAALDDPGGIKTYNSHYINIIGNILYDNFFGIYIQYGTHCVVKNNEIVALGGAEQQIGNGIHCWKSDSLQIIGNHISGHRDGIYFEFVTQSLIWRNIVEKNLRYGLHFMFSNDDAYFSNLFRQNGAGVAVMFTKNVTMMNNTFDQNWGDAAYGLLLKEISDSYIGGNHFEQNTSGIRMEGTNRITLEKNVFSNNGWAMQIQASCMDNHVSNNNFIANTFDISTNGTLLLNTLNNNYWDKYEGYDLNKDRLGDVPFHPLSLFSIIVENQPAAMLLYRSFMISLLDKSEKMFPSLTPDHFIDKEPLMQALPL
ncbi:MAG: nitrous oxide reductase family maturation protein NosD [Sphingobacteriales bacterium]|nr:nitrous oxide reductase family maturation protein NosD [Sphingobacteriales bacterium]